MCARVLVGHANLALRAAFVACAVFALGGGLAAASSSDELTRLLRFPDIHEDFVVFVYAGDVWRAPVSGGHARRLTSHPGLELFPSISPDGRRVAYTAEYTGSRQVYVMPAAGGTPRQLTFYTDVGLMPPRGGWDYWIQGWTPEGKILVRMNRTPWGERMGRYYLVDPDGGLETPLPLPEGGSASVSPDGRRLAYCPISREFRTWKRHRGGRAQDLWIYDLRADRSRRLTEFPGTDSFPMWADDGAIYFLSDRAHTLNLFSIDSRGEHLRQVTSFEEYDVLWPSLGPDAIVFQNGGYLYRFDLADQRATRIPIRVTGDLPRTVPHFVDAREFIGSADPSPSGVRAVLEARGDLFSVPAEHGPTRRITASPGVRELSPAWSPDGTRIAYLSDETGEYGIYVIEVDAPTEPRRLTPAGEVWLFAPVWSPDSKKIAFADKARRLRILEVDSGRITDVDTGKIGDLDTYRWSPDGRWLVYEKFRETRLPGIAVFSIEDGESHWLGDGLTNDYDPVFSEDGRYLFFLSDRDYPIRFSAFEFNYIYDRATRVYAAALHPSVPALFPLRSDEETSAEEGSDDEADEDSQERVTRIEPEGFTARTVALPGLDPADYTSLAVGDGAVFYLHGDDGPPFALYRYDLEKRKHREVLADVQSYRLSGSGKKILYRAADTWGLVDSDEKHSPGDGALDLDGLRVKLDPRAEWRQMFEDAWRIVRDWFYDPGMHGKDWDAIGERYRALVPHIAHRSDLDFVLGEMIGELEAGHTYVTSGDSPEVERIPGGMLGCEFDPHPSGYYRVARVFPGENWDPDYRSPLTEVGVNVKEGDFLIAIDGVEVRHPDNPYRHLEGKAGRQVTIRVSDEPSPEGAREVRVLPVSSEQNLRYLEWVESRLERVRRRSDGRIGYIHLPNTAFQGNRMLQKLFYGQADKEALIIDDRYNGGGFIPDRMIEYFSRTTLSYWARRGVESMRTPAFAHDGPKIMLINGYSSSGGDALAYYFRKTGLGLLVGTRTWGGLIGLSGNPSLVDGGSVLVPTFRIYDEEGDWVVENEGVAPDVEVVDLPEERLAGRDPSLDKAVDLLLERLDRRPVRRPSPPEPPR